MEHQYNKNLLQEDLDSSQLSPQNYTNLPESFTPEDVNLIMQVRDHPCIYCTKKSKKSKVNVENEVKLAWEEIGKNLLMNVDYCQHRWIILRQRFSKERMKSYSEDSSEHASAIERYSFYDYMKWLDPYVPRRQKRSAKSLQNNINTFKKLCVDKPNDHISDNLVLPSTSIKETLPRTPLSPPKVTTTQLKSPQLSPPEVNIIAPEEPPNFLDNIGNEEEKTVLESIAKEDPNFHGDGYTSLAIIYATFALCNWLAPSFISMTGPRTSILVGCSCYVFFIVTFMFPQTDLLYTASAIVGLGAALAWTGHGLFLTINSDEVTMSRNSGLFWAIFQTSLFIGNIFVYFVFKEPEIKEDVRNLVFKVLTGVSVVGLALLLTMRRPPQTMNLGPAEGVSSADKELQIPEAPREKPLLAAWHALRDAFQLFFTPRMLMLALTFIYTGLSLTFFSSVYSSSIGFTKAMGEDRKSLIGLSGIFIGIGEVVGGALFGVLASRFGTCSGWPVVATGFGVHTFAFISALLNLPNGAPFKDTDDAGLIAASPGLAMAGSLALGLGDACFNTQVYALLGTVYSTESASAFALFKFCQSVAAAMSFFYSSSVGLHGQLGILAVSLILGTLAFCVVEIKHRRAKRLSSNSCTDIDNGNNGFYTD